MKSVLIATAFIALWIFSELTNASNRKLISLKQEQIERLKQLVEAQQMLICLYEQKLTGMEEEE